MTHIRRQLEQWRITMPLVPRRQYTISSVILFKVVGIETIPLWHYIIHSWDICIASLNKMSSELQLRRFWKIVIGNRVGSHTNHERVIIMNVAYDQFKQRLFDISSLLFLSCIIDGTFFQLYTTYFVYLRGFHPVLLNWSRVDDSF